MPTALRFAPGLRVAPAISALRAPSATQEKKECTLGADDVAGQREEGAAPSETRGEASGCPVGAANFTDPALGRDHRAPEGGLTAAVAPAVPAL
ncbi:MAG: hypothetical protein ABIV50_05260 [Opitutus sp.]